MKNKNYLWGILIIIVGVIFLGNNLDIWNINIFFDGWWTLFIIVPSLIALIKLEDVVSSVLGLSIGILLLLASRDIINWSTVGDIFIPIVIIAVGVSFIFKPKVKVKSNGEATYLGIFSSTTEKVTKLDNKLECIAVFGGIDLDLRKVEIKEDVQIECVSVFGGIDLKLPENVVVKTNGVPIFGGIENKKDSTSEKNMHTIYINYVCIFGGIDIL